MKLKLASLVLLLSFCMLGHGFAANPPGWTDDYEKAVEKAKAEKKNVLLDFTGSDWCGFCKALDKEVFATPKFKSWAKDNVVLVKVDFPHSTPQSAKIKQQNSDLKSKYPTGGFPTIVITDPDGKELVKKVGYKPGSGPAAYLENLQGVSKPQ
jgi:protein disulfide-isomerase